MNILPNDIIELILFNYLKIEDIRACILTSRIFHVLPDYKKDIINHARKGWWYCIQNGYVKSSKWLLDLEIKLNSPIGILQYYKKYTFKTNFINC